MNGLTIPFTGLKKQYNNLRNEILDVTDVVLRSGNLMDGNYTSEFESWLAKKNGVKYAATCHSGTHALEIIAEYYASQKFWPNPPRVLVPAMTYPATINAFMRVGWDVVIVVKPTADQCNYSEILQELEKLLVEAEVLNGYTGGKFL